MYQFQNIITTFTEPKNQNILYSEHTHKFYEAAISNDFKYLATINYSLRYKISIWNLETKQLLNDIYLRDVNKLLLFKFSKDNNKLFLAQKKDDFLYCGTANPYEIQKVFIDKKLISLTMANNEKYICSISKSQDFITVFSMEQENQQIKVSAKFIINTNFKKRQCFFYNNDQIIINAQQNYDNQWQIYNYNFLNGKKQSSWKHKEKGEVKSGTNFQNSLSFFEFETYLDKRIIIQNLQMQKRIRTFIQDKKKQKIQIYGSKIIKQCENISENCIMIEVLDVLTFNHSVFKTIIQTTEDFVVAGNGLIATHKQIGQFRVIY